MVTAIYPDFQEYYKSVACTPTISIHTGEGSWGELISWECQCPGEGLWLRERRIWLPVSDQSCAQVHGKSRRLEVCPSGETHDPLAHLQCYSLEGMPKERAGGLQIFLKVRNSYYLLQLNWKRKKIQKLNPYRNWRGEMNTFDIKLEISFIFKKSTFSLKCFNLIAFFGKIFFKACFINYRIPFFIKKFNFFPPPPANYLLTSSGFAKSSRTPRKNINVEWK